MALRKYVKGEIIIGWLRIWLNVKLYVDNVITLYVSVYNCFAGDNFKIILFLLT